MNAVKSLRLQLFSLEGQVNSSEKGSILRFRKKSVQVFEENLVKLNNNNPDPSVKGPSKTDEELAL